MNYEKGDKVLVDIHQAAWGGKPTTTIDDTHQVSIGAIKSEIKTTDNGVDFYHISNIPGSWRDERGERIRVDAIMGPLEYYYRCPNCQSQVMYSDTEALWFCPSCQKRLNRAELETTAIETAKREVNNE